MGTFALRGCQCWLSNAVFPPFTRLVLLLLLLLLLLLVVVVDFGRVLNLNLTDLKRPGLELCNCSGVASGQPERKPEMRSSLT